MSREVYTEGHILQFGKYKGKPVRSVMKHDAQYLLWLRAEKYKTDRYNCFSEDVSKQLDDRLSKMSKRDRERYKMGDEPTVLNRSEVENAFFSEKLNEKREETYQEDWGAF